MMTIIVCLCGWLCLFACVLECSIRVGGWVGEHACIKRCEFVCEWSTCARVRQATSVGACTPVAVVLLTHALQAMLFLQGLAAQ